MEIILTRDVENLGLAGQVLKVSAGYARNYLLPGAFALAATPNNLKTLAKKREEFERRFLAAKEEAQLQKQALDSLVLTIERKSVEKGKLYGAVTPQDLVEAAAEQGITLDRRKLKISEPIKSLGDYEVAVRLHPEIVGTFKVKVMAEPKVEPEPVPEPEPRRGRGRRSRSDDGSRSRDSRSDSRSSSRADSRSESKAGSKADSKEGQKDQLNAQEAKAKQEKKQQAKPKASDKTEAKAEDKSEAKIEEKDPNPPLETKPSSEGQEDMKDVKATEPEA